MVCRRGFFLESNRYFVVCLLSAALMGSVCAAERPDSGTIQRTLPQPIPLQSIPSKIPENSEVELDSQGPTARIDRFDISGNESIATEEIQAILKIFVGQALSAQDLDSVKAVVGNFYRERGYWATVIFPPQDLTENTLRMEIVEAKLGSILIDADEGLRFPIDRIANYLDSEQKRGDVLRINELDSGVRKLNTVAGIEASLDLQPGELVGETDVIVVAENTPLVNGSLTADNHGSRSTDYNRGTLSVNLESPLRAGERFNFVYLNNAELLYQGAGVTAPILFDGVTISYQYTDLVYTLGTPYETLAGYGDAQSSTTTLAKPLWQGRAAEINGSIGYAHRTNYDVASGAVSTDKKIDVWNVSLSSTLQDGWLSGGFNLLSATLSNGWVDLSGSHTDWQDDQDNARTQGHFKKLAISATRIQRLTDRDSFWFIASGQHSFGRNLDSAEKMSLGGASGVRAYPASEASGDEAMLVQLEWRRQMTQAVTGKVFFDWGEITQYAKQFSTIASVMTGPNRYQLKGAGAGFTWLALDDLNLDVLVATKLGKNYGADSTGSDNDGTNYQTRLWLAMTWTF